MARFPSQAHSQLRHAIVSGHLLKYGDFALGCSGQLSADGFGATQLLLDVSGYFAPQTK